MDITDRFRGCLLGLAAGDSLGMPVEGLSADEIKRLFGQVRDMRSPLRDHFHSGLKAGNYTDDTVETLILARSMIESHGFSGDSFSRGLIRWGLKWATDPDTARGAGVATRYGISRMLSGAKWQESGSDISTCGSAMRAAPIGLLYHGDLQLTSRYAEVSSIPTHSSPAARAGSAAVASGVALSILGFPGKTVLKTAAHLSGRIDLRFGRALESVLECLDMGPEDAVDRIGVSPLVYETVPAAFYFYLKFPPEEALIKAASCGGDTDSIASIAGALAGASKGSWWIPSRWQEVLEGRAEILRTADGLVDLFIKIYK